MKIISKFVDYYDFSSPYWANSDTTFVRDYSESDVQVNDTNKRKISHLLPDRYSPLRHEKHHDEWAMVSRYLIIAGVRHTFYTFSRSRSTLSLTPEERKKLTVSELNALGYSINEKHVLSRKDAAVFLKDLEKSGYSGTRWFNRACIEDYVESVDERYERLNEEFESPILFFESNWGKWIVKRNPKLSDIFTGIPGDQVYQNIEMWLNREKPVPMTLGNEERIVKAGFDLRKSFRHRK